MTEFGSNWVKVGAGIASATEARRAETLGSVHEGAVGVAETPTCQDHGCGYPQSTCNGREGCRVMVEPPARCTCHPSDNPPKPCPRRHAYSECVTAAEIATLKEEVERKDKALEPFAEFATQCTDARLKDDYTVVSSGYYRLELGQFRAAALALSPVAETRKGASQEGPGSRPSDQAASRLAGDAASIPRAVLVAKNAAGEQRALMRISDDDIPFVIEVLQEWHDTDPSRRLFIEPVARVSDGSGAAVETLAAPSSDDSAARRETPVKSCVHCGGEYSPAVGYRHDERCPTSAPSGEVG